MKKTILLFDMDGVLVEPRRYRASLQSSMDFFGKIMGWDFLYPGEQTIAWFESRGIISEWDIAPSIWPAWWRQFLKPIQDCPYLKSSLRFVKWLNGLKSRNRRFTPRILSISFQVLKKRVYLL
jgi:hypothetical protein